MGIQHRHATGPNGGIKKNKKVSISISLMASTI